MSRLVQHDAKGPAVIQIGEGKFVAVCQCGLSRNKPFCDGSHKKTQDEAADRVYVYDHEQNRVSVDDLFPPPKSKYTAP